MTKKPADAGFFYAIDPLSILLTLLFSAEVHQPIIF